jgi:hypothetical protein
MFLHHVPDGNRLQYKFCIKGSSQQSFHHFPLKTIPSLLCICIFKVHKHFSTTSCAKLHIALLQLGLNVVEARDFLSGARRLSVNGRATRKRVIEFN